MGYWLCNFGCPSMVFHNFMRPVASVIAGTCLKLSENNEREINFMSLATLRFGQDVLFML